MTQTNHRFNNSSLNYDIIISLSSLRKKAEYVVDDALVLETIPISHYAEKVRFCMDYAGIPYTEEQDSGILGTLLLGRRVPTLRVDVKGIKVGLTLLGNCSRITIFINNL